MAMEWSIMPADAISKSTQQLYTIYTKHPQCLSVSNQLNQLYICLLSLSSTGLFFEWQIKVCVLCRYVRSDLLNSTSLYYLWISTFPRDVDTYGEEFIRPYTPITALGEKGFVEFVIRMLPFVFCPFVFPHSRCRFSCESPPCHIGLLVSFTSMKPYDKSRCVHRSRVVHGMHTADPKNWLEPCTLSFELRLAKLRPKTF